MSPKHGRRYNVSQRKFVETWTLSSSVDEVAEKLGMPKPVVQARAHAYRAKLVLLKKMPRKPGTKRIDVDGLNALIFHLEARVGAGERFPVPVKGAIKVDQDMVDDVINSVVAEAARKRRGG